MDNTFNIYCGVINYFTLQYQILRTAQRLKYLSHVVTCAPEAAASRRRGYATCSNEIRGYRI